MAESDLVSMAQAFTGLPMNELIGGPLMAACEANNMMAMTQANYILQTGFARTEVGTGADKKTVYKVVEIEMQLTRPVIIPGDPTAPTPVAPKIETVTTTVKLPLISILPIPSLGIDKVAISFDMEVKSSYGKEVSAAQTKEAAGELSFEAKFERGPFSVGIKGSASYSQTDTSSSKENIQKSNSANYHVEVSASQQPQPQGLSLILQEFAKNIGPFTMPTESTTTPLLPARGNETTSSLPQSVPMQSDAATRAAAEMFGRTSV